MRSLASALPEQRLEALAGVIAALRPGNAGDVEEANRRVQLLTEMLAKEQGYRTALKETLFQLLSEKQWVHLLADSGVLTSDGLLSGLWTRLGRKFLPEVPNPDNLRDVLGQLFARKDDYHWVTLVEDERWAYLLDRLDLGAALAPEVRRLLQLQVLEALQVLAYRIAAIGLEPELVRNHPSIERYESPFLGLAEEARQFIRERQAALAEKREPKIDDKHLGVLLDQCTEVLLRIRRQSEKSGASVSLTALLIRGEQIAGRMQTLLALLQPRELHEQNRDRVRLFKRLVRAANQRNSLRRHWSQHVELLSTRIATNAGKAGEQYITASRAEYRALFRSALGAGMLVAIAAFIKLALVVDDRAPLAEAFVYSANYVWCFLLMSLMHWTLATKQPAMTANRLAHAMDRDESGKRHLESLVELIVRTIRSQVAAILGNIVVAVPLALALGLLVYAKTGTHYIDPDKARHLLHDVDPLAPRTWVWASLTAVWLFVSGLISGYYDNKAVYDRIPQRVAGLRWLRRLIGEEGARRVGAYVENNLGALAGSFFFGIFLGSTAALGRVLGLPLDTLHVTFASANLGFAAVALDGDLAGTALGGAILGILLIGALNLLVSFSLALYVAVQARSLEFASVWRVISQVGGRLRTTPGQFFWPPASPPGAGDAIPEKPAAEPESEPARKP